MTTQEFLKTGQSRVWLQEGGAGPSVSPEYLGLARASGVDYGLGTITPIYGPSATQYGKYDVLGKIRGAPDLPSLSIEQYMQTVVSALLRIANKQCAVDMQVHFGVCQQPSDFNGWGMIRALEAADPSSFSSTDLGSLTPDDEAAIRETLTLSGSRIYDIKPITPTERATTEITDEVVDVVICDSATCGSCGVASDGCSIAFALVGPVAGSPGLPAELLFTTNRGATWTATNITTLGLAEAPNRMACVGTNLVVVSNDSNSLHYAPIADILTGSEQWVEVATGFEVGGEPNAIFAIDAQHVWIVGDGGYVYFSDDIESSVTVQDAGVSTTQDLADVQFVDTQNGLAVGASNAVLRTTNGGATWQAVTGPAPAVAINTGFMRSDLEWLVGLANGTLYYTLDAGVNWTIKNFPGSGAGQVRHVTYASRLVGYMAHDNATPRGRILRTVNGGFTWVVLPETAGTIPANDRINRLAACIDDVNLVYGGGLGDDGSDGFLVQFE